MIRLMEVWNVLTYDLLQDHEDFYLIHITLHPEHQEDLSSTTSYFLHNLSHSFQTTSIEKVIQVDYPREICHVNGIRIYEYKDFLEEIGHTCFVEEIKMICTQASLAPFFIRMVELYQDPSQNIYVSSASSPLIFSIWIHTPSFIEINIQKEFQQVHISDEKKPLQSLPLSIHITLDTKKDEHIRYTIKDDVTPLNDS